RYADGGCRSRVRRDIISPDMLSTLISSSPSSSTLSK
ncbi:hypothetical protein ADUPG1_014719, partial [Aduncisulcus paluster]